MGMSIGSNAQLILTNNVWKYFTGTAADTNWYKPGFDDSSWSNGPAQLGYGDGDEATVIPSGTTGSYYPCYYFRDTFDVANPSQFVNYTINYRRDDGIVIYINGTEVTRENMPSGTIDYTTWASAACTDDGANWITYNFTGLITTGSNTIAVEVHQAAPTSSDVTFELELRGNTSNVSLVRGPYLQIGTKTGVIVRWRTDLPTQSKLLVGTDTTNLSVVYTNNGINTEHIAPVTNLQPGTKYYYRIADTNKVFQGDSTNYFYTTPAGNKKTRIWATGDCGTGFATQTNVLNSYLNHVGNEYTDVWLLLGDNAYGIGLDWEYQARFFNPYQTSRIMKQTVLWPAPGNHDYYATSTCVDDKISPYYDNFNLPSNGEAGGVPSNSESYYSYNYSNIHFVSLDSYGQDNFKKFYDTTSIQIDWLKQDLAANTQLWTIVYWHHPPYTKGSHDSDIESDLVAVRENVVRILERYNVDLVLCGHSHCYERSKLLKGHYGLEASFDSLQHNHSHSNGNYISPTTCPYIKQSSDSANVGIVYAVAGSAGKFGGTSNGWPHNAMVYSDVSMGGALAIEIEENRLDAKWINENGVVADQFTMMKNTGRNYTYTITEGDSVLLTPSWKGRYAWSNGDTTASIYASPDTTTSMYVTDVYNCISDTFDIEVTPNGLKKYTTRTLKIYPNPAQEFVDIVTDRKCTSVNITNLLGHEVISEKISAVKTRVDIRSLTNGIYFVKTDNNTGYTKLLINR